MKNRTHELDAEMIVAYDCDDTLVMWTNPHELASEEWLAWEKACITIIDPYNGEEIRVKPHFKHIDVLKRHKAQGYAIVVWSAGGAKWAKAVKDALGLQDFVDLTMAKFSKFVDDLPAPEVLVGRLYLEDK